MRTAALAMAFCAITLVVLPGCGSNDDPWGPLYIPGVPTTGSRTFNCTKICRDADGNVVNNIQRQVQADTQADAVENAAAYGVCPEGSTEQVACQPADNNQ